MSKISSFPRVRFELVDIFNLEEGDVIPFPGKGEHLPLEVGWFKKKPNPDIPEYIFKKLVGETKSPSKRNYGDGGKVYQLERGNDVVSVKRDFTGVVRGVLSNGDISNLLTFFRVNYRKDVDSNEVLRRLQNFRLPVVDGCKFILKYSDGVQCSTAKDCFELNLTLQGKLTETIRTPEKLFHFATLTYCGANRNH